jgi:transcriptional regulator with XRE-family HTH domain
MRDTDASKDEIVDFLPHTSTMLTGMPRRRQATDDFGARLRWLREQLRLSKADVASLAGFSGGGYVHKVEVGDLRLSTVDSRKRYARGVFLESHEFDDYIEGRLPKEPARERATTGMRAYQRARVTPPNMMDAVESLRENDPEIYRYAKDIASYATTEVVDRSVSEWRTWFRAQFARTLSAMGVSHSGVHSLKAR